MNTTKLTLQLTVVWILALATPLHARSTTFTYQGNLLHGRAPAQGLHEMYFTLHNAPDDGMVTGGGYDNHIDAYAIGANIGGGVSNVVGRGSSGEILGQHSDGGTIAGGVGSFKGN